MPDFPRRGQASTEEQEQEQEQKRKSAGGEEDEGTPGLKAERQKEEPGCR